MNDIRKERLMISIASLAALACVLQNYIGGWEFWVPPILILFDAALWWLHVAQKWDSNVRTNLCFMYSTFLLFYLGVHDTSLFDISVASVLFMACFTMFDQIPMLNAIMVEYIIVMAIQFVFLYRSDELNMDAFTAMRIVLHIGTFLAMYTFSRITVSRRLLEKEKLDEWKKTVAENDHDIEDFLSNISHELRTPVNVINGMTTILQKEGDSEGLTSIKEAGIRLQHQIEDIQDYTELKRGELSLEEENYMCLSLVNDVVANFRAMDKKNRLELVVDLDPKTPTLLKGDIRKLHKLFRHLLDNAVKFTKRGGVYIKVYSLPHEYGVNLMVEVTDTGVGMTRADMALVSSGMYQANKKRNRSTGGIGIGLPIVYGFVHKMDGFVKIESVKGKGTTVRLSIPQKVVDSSPCLAVKDGSRGGLAIYTKLEKYTVPEIRDFNKQMAINLAKGIDAKLYAVGEKRELDHLISDVNVSTVFVGQEEYEQEKDMLDELASQGYKVVISVDPDFDTPVGKGVLVMPKPIYGFPIVRILNDEYENEMLGNEVKGKLRFTGVSALIVDDEPMNLVVASGLLREYKMFADTAESGKDALEKYESGEYDVIFMDHMMPEMDGVEAMKRIRQLADSTGRSPIIIALTANALSGAREMFMKEGFDGFIAKPIDISEFERVMKNVLPEEMLHYEGRDE